MQPTPDPTPPPRSGPPPSATGELIIQNGRLKGTRRALVVPMTFLGKAAACDVRLNVDGISPLHCLVVRGEEGFLLRDLESETGTLVNGERVASCQLRDGDQLTVGPFQFRLRLPRTNPAAQAGPRPSGGRLVASAGPDVSVREKEALRIQVAAVVAQQVSLTEEEARLQQRRAALEQQEAQLAAHLEEKRRRLVELHTQAQAARDSLQHDRETYEQHVEKVTGDLGQAERELLDKQQQVEAERQRALNLRRRLKHRFHRNWQAEREAMRRREHDVADAWQQLERENERVQQEKATLAQACLRFNGDMELGRRQLQNERDKLRQEQKQWKERHDQQQSALQEWASDLDQREAGQAEAENVLAQERERWRLQRFGLQRELEGLENRIRNQRRKVVAQQREINHLEGVLHEFQRRLDPSAAPSSDTSKPTPAQDGTPAAGQAPSVKAVAAEPAVPAGERSYALMIPPSSAPPDVLQPGGDALAPAETAASSTSTVLHRHLQEVEKLAGDLADQRLQLAEQWERLAQTRHGWQQQRDAASRDLTALALHLQQQGQALMSREQQLEAGVCELRQRHNELMQLRQHLVGWQSRLRAREMSWEAERDRLLADLRSREELADRHLTALVDLRQRWAKRRRQELDVLRAERAACEKVRQQYITLREERRRRNKELEEERRTLTSKALALEQYRQECLNKSGDAAAADRRMDRLRRRWMTENAAALRAVSREREAVQAEIARIEERHNDVQKRAGDIGVEKAGLDERLTEWEHKQLLAEAQQARLRQELQTLQAQRDRSEQQLTELQNEVERIARVLLDEPEAPTLLQQQAA